MEILLGEPVGPVGRTGPLGPLRSPDLAGHYPWPDRDRWLRVVMVRTLDGAVAGPDGRSRSISSTADRAVLAAVRRFSDVTLVGASTVREEPYGPWNADPDSEAERRAAGLAVAPAIAVVSGSLDLPWSEPMFTSGTRRVLVVTTATADPDAVRTARRYAEVLQLPGATPAPGDVVDALVAAGLRRIVCEGGPTLAAALAGRGLVDEVDLSMSPFLAGRGAAPAGRPAGRDAGAGVAAGAPVELEGFDLAQVIADDGFLFTRYVARRHRRSSGDDDLGSGT